MCIGKNIYIGIPVEPISTGGFLRHRNKSSKIQFLAFYTSSKGHQPLRIKKTNVAKKTESLIIDGEQ